MNKLKTAPANLSKLSNVVDNMLLKRVCMIKKLQYLIPLILRYHVLMD